ncbi:NERD domain-containing protein [Blastopirellula sp. J2-11]|uniref:nuclease-related domain-containing protein n=1 Tax=Blastopirellula sp. J2-11 TaxID=2943192 RepID=UPI0021C890A9|nr:nuclease-related domain-containing protein [Blastopirellula sp. J2-11]UUO08407.1 NERD domain-containing protein [Blastopirellula sp. J2-11]
MQLFFWKMVTVTFPLLMLILGSIGIFLTGHFWRRSHKRDNRESPLNHDLLRPPGFSLTKRLDEIDSELNLQMAWILAIPGIVYTVHLSLSYFGGEAETVFRTVVSALFALGMTIYSARKLMRLLTERKNFILGRDGEMFTGEVLNQLMRHGCRVFHDIEFPYGNIDHVAVCPSGVFSINTKMHSKPKKGKDKAAANVDYVKNRITFPDRYIEIPLQQLECEAKWLSQELSSATALPISVVPMLALPGWFVQHLTRPTRITVFNPFNCEGLFLKRAQKLSPEQIRQVAYQLEQRCHKIAPSFREPRSWDSKTAK